jgi:AcrR family transcriptional regulator
VPAASRMTADERRTAILDVALRMFSERGFRGTTTRALAEACGVTEPVIYEHFKSKHDLYAAIIEAKSGEGWSRAAGLLEPYAEARDDRGYLSTLGRIVLQAYIQDRAYARLLLSVAIEDPELGLLFYERQKPARERFAAYIAERIRDGAFRPIDPRRAARSFIGMVAYQGIVGMLYNDDFVEGPPAQFVEDAVDIFLRGITVAESPGSTSP